MMLATWTAAGRCKAAPIALALAGASVPAVPALAETSRSVVVVLDASGSMNERLPEGRTRIEAAKAAVADVLGSLAPDIRLGLRVYGHQSAPDKKNCEDSELVAGFAPVAEGRQAILDKVAGLKARGYTPITLSLQRAAEDIAKEPSAERTVVLVSDGRETCRADPCVAAKALAAADAKLVIHAIGLGVDAATRGQLQCIANAARGSYFDARSGPDLAATIGKAVVTKKTAVTLKVATAKTGTLTAPRIKQGGLSVTEAETGKEMDYVGGLWPKRELPVGIYNVKLVNGLWTGVEIRAGETTVLQPAFLRVDVAKENRVADNVYLLDPETGEEVGYFSLLTTPEVPLVPGRVVPRIGAFVWPAMEVTPDRTAVLTPGVIKVNDPLHRTKLLVYVVTPSSGGPEHSFLPDRPVYLPAGKYLVWSTDTPSEKAEVEVADGQALEIKIERQ
jgi:von Willebrand factor type A domain